MSSKNEDSESEELKWLSKKKRHLEDWKDNLKGANDALPFVESNLVNTEWAIEAIKNQPTISGGQPILGFAETMKRDYDYTVSAIPPIPTYDPSQLDIVSSVTASGTASVYGYIQSFDRYDTPETKEYVKIFSTKYEDIQKAQLRQQNTRSLVEKLKNSGTLDRFDRAQAANIQVKSGIINSTQAASSEMRNLLYGIKGDLIELARKTPREKLSWQEMVRRLSKPGLKDEPLHTLISQEAVYTSLTNQLSETAKDWKPLSSVQLNHIWIQVLDFIYTVLGLINLS
ncbi:hypothetical protein ACFLUK_01770 [Chloroflexota bacterium]